MRVSLPTHGEESFGQTATWAVRILEGNAQTTISEASS